MVRGIRSRLASAACVLVVTALPTTVVRASQPQPGTAETAGLRGQAGKDTSSLSLQDAVAEALARNPALVVLRREYDIAQTRPAQERFLPAPSFEARIWQWPTDTLNPASPNMYMFTVSQPIPGFGKRGLRATLAEKDAELAAADIAVRARHIIDQVKQAYADLFLARREIAVHHASVDLLRQLADAAQAKYATGGTSQQDVLRAVLELSRIQEHLIGLEERTGLTEARLNTLLDRPPQASIGPLADPTERVLLPPVESLQRLALEHQPELLVSRLAVERAEAQRAVVTQEYKPDFFVGGGYFLMPGQRDAVSVGVGITWPRAPWSRPGLDARHAEAETSILAARARGQQVTSALRLAVQEAYVRVKAAEQRAALLRTTVLPQSRQTLAVSRVAYQTDRADILAIIDNERVRLDAELAYVRGLSDLDRALADLERAVGMDLPTDMIGVAQATSSGHGGPQSPASGSEEGFDHD